MRWTHWRAHFEAQARRPLPSPGAAGSHAKAKDARVLGHSLAKFQLGEAGEGRIAHEIYRVELAGIDDDYRSALGLFVAEEGRHARLLAQMVQALGGHLLRRNWTDWLFVRGRRLLGLRLKLVVLLAAEIVGLNFYRLIARSLPRGRLRTTLREICRDELFHLRCHADFLANQSRGVFGRWGLRGALWVVCLSAAAVVAFDHRETLKALDISAGSLLRRMAQLTVWADRTAYSSSGWVPGDARATPSRRLSSRAACRDTSTRSPPCIRA